MPAALLEKPAPVASQNPPRKRWTREECEKIEAAGVDLERVELIEGELIDRMAKNRPHVDAATLMNHWLTGVFGVRPVNFEAPIDVDPQDKQGNKPIPDLIVLKPSYSGYRTTMPQSDDLLLVVEIADTSLQFDLTTKAALYARAGIPDYWVLDVFGRRLLVHREPQNGEYRSVMAYGENESVAPLAAPASLFRVGDVFPQ